MGEIFINHNLIRAWYPEYTNNSYNLTEKKKKTAKRQKKLKTCKTGGWGYNEP